MPIASTAMLMNIPLAHSMGGERSGTIDESIRHAISKMANLHFVANADAMERLKKMMNFQKQFLMLAAQELIILMKLLKNLKKATCFPLKQFLKNLVVLVMNLT